MDVVSVESVVMGPEAATPMSDPRHVVSPLDPDQAEELLCKYDLIVDWNHVIVRLHEGFDVRIPEQLSHLYIFC